MKVSYGEGSANHIGSESGGGVREDAVEALTGESADLALSSEILIVPEADALMSCGRRYRTIRQLEDRAVLAESKTLCTHRQVGVVTEAKLNMIASLRLPKSRDCHSYPEHRLA